MHLLKHKDAPKAPLIPTRSVFWRPEHPRLKGRRYNARGEFMHATGPKIAIDPVQVRNMKERIARETARPVGPEWKPFDVASYQPLRGMMLMKRPEPIKELNGLLLAEKDWIFPPGFIVVRVGAGVDYSPGQRVVLQRKHRPWAFKLDGIGQHYLARAKMVVGVIE